MPSRQNKKNAQTTPDANTIELATQLQQNLKKKLGKKPHMIKLNVARGRLDANRPVGEACYRNRACEKIYNDYHNKIRVAIQ